MIRINLLPWRENARKQRHKKVKCILSLSIFLLASLFLLLARSFYQKPSHKNYVFLKPPTHTAYIKIPAKIKSIVLTDGKIDHLEILSRTSLRQLKWVGFLEEKQQVLAFLKAPTGETVSVKSGDKIGIEEASIVLITPQQITFKIKNKIIHISRSSE